MGNSPIVHLQTFLLNEKLNLCQVTKAYEEGTHDEVDIEKRVFDSYPSASFHNVFGHHVYKLNNKIKFIDFLKRMASDVSTKDYQQLKIHVVLQNIFYDIDEEDSWYHEKFSASKRHRKVLIIYHPSVIPYILWSIIYYKKWLFDLENPIEKILSSNPPKQFLDLFPNSKANTECISIVSWN